MTEKEKRDSGIMYGPDFETELQNEALKCKDMCLEYNMIPASHLAERDAMIRKIFGKTGKKLTVYAPLWCDYGYNVEVGENFFANHNTVILDVARVSFGDNVFVAPNCGFYAAGHPADYVARNKGLEYAWPITVGSNVWIGAGVHVMPGVTIGSNVVIGGGSVVVKDIPDNVVAAGNPCRPLHRITEKDIQKDYIWHYDR
jgi:maltose O-acetyltransferase